jgi:hypothetical protein
MILVDISPNAAAFMSCGWWMDVNVRCTTIQVVVVWELCWFRVFGYLIIVGTLVGHSLAQTAAFWAERCCQVFVSLWVACCCRYIGTHFAEMFFSLNGNYFSDSFRIVKPLVETGNSSLVFARIWTGRTAASTRTLSGTNSLFFFTELTENPKRYESKTVIRLT